MSDRKTDWENIKAIAMRDCAILEDKDKEYGASWKKRGGISAFMMLCRKWDRIENSCEKKSYDIFAAGSIDFREEGLLDDLGDLRRYLLLVEEHLRWLKSVDEGPTSSYVDQD